MLSRDFMSLKLWDLAMEGAPVATLQVHEEVRPRVSGLLFCSVLLSHSALLLFCLPVGPQSV
jgi:hypothetical protein